MSDEETFDTGVPVAAPYIRYQSPVLKVSTAEIPVSAFSSGPPRYESHVPVASGPLRDQLTDVGSSEAPAVTALPGSQPGPYARESHPNQAPEVLEPNRPG